MCMMRLPGQAAVHLGFVRLAAGLHAVFLLQIGCQNLERHLIALHFCARRSKLEQGNQLVRTLPDSLGHKRKTVRA